MANKYIGDLTAVSTLASGDEFVVNTANNNGTKKITYSNFRNALSFEEPPTELTQTLSAGSTSLTFSNAAIKTTSIIDIYASVWGVSPTAVTVTSGQAVLTFNSYESAVSIKLLVR